MAKGFKVIPKETQKKEEWDYERIKQRVKGKQIVFCLPGRGCSYTFLKNFVQLSFDLVQNGMGNTDISRLFFNGQLCTL